jgi:hypothetical protein
VTVNKPKLPVSRDAAAIRADRVGWSPIARSRWRSVWRTPGEVETSFAKVTTPLAPRGWNTQCQVSPAIVQSLVQQRIAGRLRDRRELASYLRVSDWMRRGLIPE